MDENDLAKIKGKWDFIEIQIANLTQEYLRGLQQLRTELQADIDALVLGMIADRARHASLSTSGQQPRGMKTTEC